MEALIASLVQFWDIFKHPAEFVGLHPQWIYLVLFVGTFFEGETFVIVLAGLFAQREDGGQYLPWLIFYAFAGSLCGDQFAFFIGRKYGRSYIEKRPGWKDRAERVNQLLARYRDALILSFRFLYGLRNLTPFVLGAGDISFARFLSLNVVGALLWSAAFNCGGFFLGNMVQKVLEDFKHLQIYFFGGLGVLVLVFWLRRHAKKKRERAELAREMQAHPKENEES